MCPSSRIRFGEIPSRAATPTSSGSACASSSRSSRKLARLDELLQPGLDPGADAGELAGAPGTDELRDVDGRRPDHLGRPAVGAHGVVARPGEVEQCGEGFESLGEGGVLHV